MLAKYCQQKQNGWDTYLPQLLMAYRSSSHSTTQKTPNHMVFGREITLPFQAMICIPKEGENQSVSEYVQQLKDSIEEAHTVARKNIKKQSIYQKKYYDLTAVKRSLVSGQLVWVYNPVRKIGVCQKLSNKWCGPFVVTRRIDDLTYMVKKSAKTNAKSYHIDHLRVYKGKKCSKMGCSKQIQLDCGLLDYRNWSPDTKDKWS
jgi:hypothetical protein